MERVTAWATQHGIGGAASKAMAQALLLVFRGAYQHNLSPAHLSDDLAGLGFSPTQVNALISQWRSSQAALAASSLGQTLMVNKLVLPEWRFGLTLSGTEWRNVGASFMQLKLALDRGDGQLHYEHVELSLPQFYEFLATLEKAKAQMDFFS